MKNKSQRILVGLDGSVESLKALDKAIELAYSNQAELVIAHIIDLRSFSTAASLDPEWADAHQQGAEKFLDDFAQEAKDAGIHSVKTVLEMGAPKVLLSTTIPQKEAIDLIVIGATGMSRLERILMGSVSQYIIGHSLCDVYVVR